MKRFDRYFFGELLPWFTMIVFFLLAAGCSVAIWNSPKVEAMLYPEVQEPFIHIDMSAETGYMNSENIMARFEGVEYPIAGSDEMEVVFLVDVFYFPELNAPVTYRVDSFVEARNFLHGLVRNL